jgi:hypothetical protein
MEKFVDIGIPNFDFFSLVQQCGFPIALAVVCGWIVMQAIQLVLGSVVKSIKKMTFLIKSMDGRVKQMNVDIIEIDKLISQALNVQSLPEKIHHEVAAVMNSHDVKQPIPTKPVPDNPKKSIREKFKNAVDNVIDKNVDSIVEKVEGITK